MATRKPRIWVVGFSLTGFLPDIIPDFAAQAEIRVLNKIFEEGREAALELLAAGDADVFIAAGANGAYLRSVLPAPVVMIKVTGFDILHALMKAREVSDRIAIFSYQAISAELEEVKEILRLDIEQCFYTTPEDAKERVRELASQGYQVVVGSSMVSRLAEEAGLRSVFLYSANSVRQAVEDAVEIARLARIEETQREWLSGILHQLDEAVVAVDMQERVQALNPAMAALLGVSQEWAGGRKLSEIEPAFSMEHTLRTGEAGLEQIERVGRRTLVTNRLPIREGGQQTGAVLTCRDAVAIERADRNLRLKNRPSQFVAKYHIDQIVGESQQMREVRSLAERYARTDATVLILGESGTGKELIAQGIHNESPRQRGPFVAINCAAFPESLLESELFGYEEGAFTGSRKGGKTGLFESAHTGTIFLDEIGEMPLALQTRLLRVLQEREVLRLGGLEPVPVDVRVIAATNRNLREAIRDGLFREDLFYRLNILQLILPPLRERGTDVERLTEHLLAQSLRRLGARVSMLNLLPVLLPVFGRYDWPGNVRELENVVERVTVFLGDAPPEAGLDESRLRAVVPELFQARPDVLSADAGAADQELERMLKVLESCGGNQSEACRRLGMGRTTLWRRLKALQGKATPSGGTPK